MTMWTNLCLCCVILQVTYGKLIGDNICLTNQSFTVNVTEYYLRNATVRNYQWCLNVPPRCSYYTITKINDTRIVEKNETVAVEKCCPDFYQEDDRCIALCKDCINGICLNNSCQCFPGFQGKGCDARCSQGYYGSNCSEICNCKYGACDPLNGNCIQSYSTEKYTTKNEDFDTPATIVATTTSKDIINNWVLEPETDTDNTKLLNEQYLKNTQYTPNNIIISKEIDLSEEEHFKIAENITDLLLNNSFLESNKQTKTVNTITTSYTDKENNQKNLIVINELDISTVDILKEEVTTERLITDNSGNTENFQDDFLINRNKELFIPVQIKYDRLAKPLLQNDISSTLSSRNFEDHNYVLAKNNTGLVQQAESNKLVNGVSVSAITFISLIIVVLVILIYNHIRKPKERTNQNEVTKKTAAMPTVSVYTTSIFHTPLPEPPVVEDAAYLTPKQYPKRLKEQKTFETHVVCNLNMPITTDADYVDYVYDHPPSTGSYRAASTIEPLELDINNKTNLKQLEPVYDEIPYREPQEYDDVRSPHDHSTSLYINTCGRTKL